MGWLVKDMKTRLSPTASYYIRKLVRQFSNDLKSVVAPGAGLRTDITSDLNAVLNSLYLEDDEIQHVIRRLEDLASFHQALQAQVSSYNNYSEQLKNLERQIFWLLGLKLAPLQQEHLAS